ncbi:MAG: carboxypeptidase-like regulatory domain-containing protein, partial [Deltaproteobacteria bacterium]
RIARGMASRPEHAAAVVAALGGPLFAQRGRVESPDGRPLGGAIVDIILVLEGRTYPLAQALTDDDGGFALTGLPGGSYWLVARAPGRVRCVETVRIHDASPAPLTLSLGLGAQIAGTVTTAPARGGNRADVHPLANVVVRALPDGGGEGPPFATRADERGEFVIDNLPPGIYRVEVAEPGFEPSVRRAVPAPSRGLAFAIRQLAAVRGTVRTASGLGATGATITIAGSGIWPARSTDAHSNGTFEIVGIPSGVYEVRARAGTEVAEPVAPLMLEPGDTRDIVLTVTPGASLDGRVLDAVTQQPIAGARVVLAEDALDAAPRAIIAGADGSFHAVGLLRRPHQVSARAPGYVPRMGALAIPGLVPVVLALDRQVAVTGRVVDGRGAPVAGAQLEVMARDLDDRVAWLTASSIAFRDALFTAQARGPRPLIPAGELGVMPGRVPSIPLTQPGGGSPWLAADAATQGGYVTDALGRFHIDEVPPGVINVVATHPAFVRGESAQRAVRAGESVEIEIVMHQGGTIDGRLVDERGFPVPGQPVEVRIPGDPYPRRAFSQRDGTFRVPSVLGHVTVVALVAGRVGARAEADVGDDAVVPVTLTLDRGVRRLRGRVMDSRQYPVAGAEIVLASSDRGASSSRTVSAADGTFDTMVLGVGAVAIDVHHPGFAPRSMRVTDTTDDVTVELAPGARFTMEVAGDGCTTGDVQVDLRTVCGPLRRTLHGRGIIEAEHLCPGRITVVATAPGCVRAERTVTLPGDGLDAPRLDMGTGGGASGEAAIARSGASTGTSTEASVDASTGASGASGGGGGAAGATGRWRCASSLPRYSMRSSRMAVRSHATPQS